MRLIVLADTHSEDLPAAVLEAIRKADMIIHAGDFSELGDYNRLKKLQDIRSVYGNMDGPDLRAVMPKKVVFRCEQVTIGIYHGEGAPDMVLDKVRAAFRGERVDVVVFGHSHQPCNERIDGVLYFNPGSPTDMVRAPYRSYGVLEISGDSVKASIVKIGTSAG